MASVDPPEPPVGVTAGVTPHDAVASAGAVLAAVEARLDGVEQVLAQVDEGADGSCARCGAPLPAEQLVATPRRGTCTPTCRA